MRVALLNNRNTNQLPEGIALSATSAVGCGPVLSSFRVQPLSTRRKPLPPIANRSASHPAIASGAADHGVESVQARLSPAAIAASPTMLATTTTAPATADDFAFGWPHGLVRSGCRTITRSPARSIAG